MAKPNRFSYYDRLSKKDKATYRKSDAITAIPLPDAAGLAPFVDALEAALTLGKRAGVASAVERLTNALLLQLEAPPLKVHVRLVRPSGDDGRCRRLTPAGDGNDRRPQGRWRRRGS